MLTWLLHCSSSHIRLPVWSIGCVAEHMLVYVGDQDLSVLQHGLAHDRLPQLSYHCTIYTHFALLHASLL